MRLSQFRNKAFQALLSLCLLVTGALAAFPVFWMIYSSLKTKTEIYQKPWAFPEKPAWQNFSVAWKEGGLDRYLWNSVVVTGASVTLILAAGSLCGYACGRMKFGSKKAIEALYLLGLLLPVQAAVIPLFLILKKAGLLNHLASLILAYAAWGLPMAMFIFREFSAEIPKEYEEAGRIDGCSEMGLFTRIFLPLCKPAIGTVVLFSGLASWNELLMALLFIEDERLKTLPVGLLAFFGYRQVDYSLLFAGLTLITLPMLAVYFGLQRAFIRGLEGGLGGLR